MIADDSAVLLEPIEVAEHRGGADVRAFADVSIAHVAQVRHLCVIAEVGVLDLHEGSGLGVVAHHRARAQVGERANCRISANDRKLRPRVDDI